MKKAYVIGTTSEGFAATLALLSRGFSVTLISNEDIRNQHRIFLEPETIQVFYNLTKLSLFDINLDINTPFKLTLENPNQQLLESMTDEDTLDFEFFKVLEKYRCIIPSHMLLDYQERKLHHIMRNGTYNYYSSSTLLHRFEFQKNQELSIHKGNYQVVDINGENQELMLLNINTKEKVSEHFDVLVDATGREHKVTSMIGSGNKRFEVQYDPLNTIRNKAFGTIILNVANPTKTLQCNPISTPSVGAPLLTMRDLPNLKKLGWNEDHLPFYVLNYTAENNEIYFRGEVPEHFLDCNRESESHELLCDWANAIINIAYSGDIKLHCLEKTNKHRDTLLLSPSSFSSVSAQSAKCANTNAIPLPMGGAFFIIGGAFMQRNSLLGNELKSALDDANSLFPCFDEHANLSSLAPMVEHKESRVEAHKNQERSLLASLETQHEKLLQRPAILRKKAFVIGMGPGGYTAAQALLAKGFSVTLIDKRDDKTLYGRTHGIFFKPETIKRFFALTKLQSFGIDYEISNIITLTLKQPSQKQLALMNDEDHLDFEFFKEFESSKCTMAIHRIQQYQEQKLQHMIRNGGYHYSNDNFSPKFFELKEDQELSIHKGNFEIIDVNGKTQEITLLEQASMEEIALYFDVLVDATGSRHEITSLIGENNKKFKVDYTPLPTPRHNAFGVLIRKVANPPIELEEDPVPGVGKTLLKPEDLPILRELGWDQDYLPICLLKYAANKQEIYFTGEVPKHFLENNNNKKQQKFLEKWASIIITLTYTKNKCWKDLEEITRSSSEFEFTATSLSSVFSQSPQHANTNIICLPEGGIFCIIGDAFLPANFLFGHGIESVLSDVDALADCFDEGKFKSPSAMLEQKKNRVKAYNTYDQHLRWFLETQQKESVSQAARSQLFSAPNSNTSDANGKMETKTDTPTFQ